MNFRPPKKLCPFLILHTKTFLKLFSKNKTTNVSFLTKFFSVVSYFIFTKDFFFQFIPLSSPHNYDNELINKKKQQKPEKKDYV